MYIFELYRLPYWENATIEDALLVGTYLEWKKKRDNKSSGMFQSFKEYAGQSFQNPPRVKFLDFYEKYYSNLEFFEDEDDYEKYYSFSGYEVHGVFEKLVRIGKATQFPNWVVQHTPHKRKKKDEKPIDSLMKLEREDLERMLEACIQTRRYGIKKPFMASAGHHYEVNEAIARCFMPIYQFEDGHLFCPYNYDDNYAEQIIGGINALNKILSATCFDTHAIYCKF